MKKALIVIDMQNDFLFGTLANPDAAALVDGTVNEILSLSQRFEVAAMLRSRKTYLEIAEKTGASTATISRVNKCLSYGTGGYEEAICSLGEEVDETL